MTLTLGLCHQQIYQSLSPEIKALMDSGQVRIQIRGLSPGSVVVIFSIISTPSQSQDISNVSTAVLNSLINITKYTVDRNSTSTTGIFLYILFSDSVFYETRAGRNKTEKCFKA